MVRKTRFISILLAMLCALQLCTVSVLAADEAAAAATDVVAWQFGAEGAAEEAETACFTQSNNSKDLISYVGSVYGKESTDYALKFAGMEDKLEDGSYNDNGPDFRIQGAAKNTAVSAGQSMRISFDVAIEDVGSNVHTQLLFGYEAATENEDGAATTEIKSVKLGNDAAVFRYNNGTITMSGSAVSGIAFPAKQWNNITLVYTWAEGGNVTVKSYINGQEAATKTVENFTGDRIYWLKFYNATNNVENATYYDNVRYQVYPAGAEVPTSFTESVTSTLGEVNTTAKNIYLADNKAMTVSELKAASTGLTVIGTDGSTAADDVKVIACSSVGTFATDGFNSYFVPYTIITNRVVYMDSDLNSETISTSTANSWRDLVTVGNVKLQALAKGSTIGAVSGLGGKTASDQAIAIQTTDYTTNATTDPFWTFGTINNFVDGVPYSLEFKIYVSGDANTWDLYINSLKVVELSNGSLKQVVFCEDGTNALNNAVKTGEWVSVALTYDPNAKNVTMYYDGAYIGEFAASKISKPKDIRFRQFVASDGTTAKSATMAIDDIKFYSGSLDGYVAPGDRVVYMDSNIDSASVSTRTNSNGSIATINKVSLYGYAKNDGTTVSAVGNLGGKTESDKALAIQTVNYTTTNANNDPFIQFNKVSDFDTTSPFTLEFKLFLSGDATSWDLFMGNQIIKFDNDGNLQQLAFLADGGNNVINNGVVKDRWVSVAVSYDPTTSQISYYYDGAFVGTYTKAGVTEDVRFRQFIPENTTGVTATMAIDDIKFYSGDLEAYTVTYLDAAGNKTAATKDAAGMTITYSDSITCCPILCGYTYDASMNKLLQKVALPTAGTQTVTIDNLKDYDIVNLLAWKSLETMQPLCTPIGVYGSAKLDAYACQATLSAAFGDGMVLQGGMPVSVWGTSTDEDGTKINVSLGEEQATAYVLNGNWQTELPAMEYSSTPQRLVVTTAAGQTTVNNILIGDVYYVGGQSNAWYPMNGVDTWNADKNSASAADNIRVFDQEAASASTVQANPDVSSKWRVTDSADNLKKCSALGYYFAKALREGGVTQPIGIIEIARSGAYLRELVPQAISQKYGVTAAGDTRPLGCNYNAMAAPVEKLHAKGLLWYQGESDSAQLKYDSNGLLTDASMTYLETYQSMLKDYIDYFNQVNGTALDVYTVQLSSHGLFDGTAANVTTGWKVPVFRSMQVEFAEANGYAVIPSLDLGYRTGESDFAHPQRKKLLAQRVANVALANEYGLKTASDVTAPSVKAVTFNDDGSATVTFNNVGSGLKTADGSTEVKGFELICGSDRHAATATITGTDTVTVKADGLTAKGDGVRYGFYHSAPLSAANLVSGSDVPCLTFARGGNALKVSYDWGIVESVTAE